MGLFSSIFGGSKSGTVSPEEFYKQCVEATHESLKKLGYANRGVIFIPELMAMGKEAILKDFDNARYAIIGGDPEEFYDLISSLAFMAGVAFADKWHHNYDELKNGYKDKVIEEGSVYFGGPILMNAFDLEDGTDLINKMYFVVFHAWFTLHEPYWAMEDPRPYILNGLLAAYQAGISTILEKYGY